MWDLHAVSGSVTTIANLTTILLGGDRATVAGVPTHPNCTLIYHGDMGTLADTLLEYRLLNNDMPNPRQGFDYTLNASSLAGSCNFRTTLRSQLQRLQGAAANTGTRVTMAYTIDYYGGQTAVWKPTGTSEDYSNVINDSNTFGATTAVTYQEKGYVPTNPLDTGTYAILGADVTALTTNPYYVLRFYHNDFNGFYPGFPGYDNKQFALARGVVDENSANWFPAGYQFVAMGECPTFTATADGTGLTFACATISAVTPVINVVLKKIRDNHGNLVV